MDKNCKKVFYTHLEEVGFSDFYYKHPAVNCIRSPRTFGANRQACADINDDELCELGYFTRGARRKLPTTWDDLQPSRVSCKSWKDFSRKHRQWE
jgi:hypothetical protein